ncbi:unnamed protein product [Linum trigynum]|uniref:Uncharacterized protein n=1 Tax=Linum trigynum TaxID=586398 RepID=A0AAV2E508_9ROSI
MVTTTQRKVEVTYTESLSELRSLRVFFGLIGVQRLILGTGGVENLTSTMPRENFVVDGGVLLVGQDEWRCSLDVAAMLLTFKWKG